MFGYDNACNMTTGAVYLDDLTSSGQKTPVQAGFVYDYQNNLVRAEQVLDNRILGTYVYDALGRRVWKTAWDRQTEKNVVTFFWYSGV